MKKQYLVILGVVGLLAAFVVARYVYQGKRAEKMDTMAKTVDSPLSRAYAQTLGPDDAKVVIVEFFDPACETCKIFSVHVKNLMAAHPGKVKLVMRYAAFHPGSDKVVQILEAARLQGKYWETLQLMFERQGEWASHHAPRPELLWTYLPAAGVDVEKVQRDLNDPGILKILQQDTQDAETLGVRQTPEFFVNGKPMPSFGYEQLKGLIDSAVAEQYGR